MKFIHCKAPLLHGISITFADGVYCPFFSSILAETIQISNVLFYAEVLARKHVKYNDSSLPGTLSKIPVM